MRWQKPVFFSYDGAEYFARFGLKAARKWRYRLISVQCNFFPLDFFPPTIPLVTTSYFERSDLTDLLSTKLWDCY